MIVNIGLWAATRPVRRLRRRPARLSPTRSSTRSSRSGGAGARPGCRMAGLRDPGRRRSSSSAPSTTLIAVRGHERTTSRRRRRDRRGRDRLAAPPDPQATTARRAIAAPSRSRRRPSERRPDDRTDAEEPLRGELRDELVRGACSACPSWPAASSTLTPLSGGITNRNFRVDASAGRARPLRHPAGRQRHAPARDQPRGRARRDGRRGRRRRGAGGDRVHPARGLPRHPVHRRRRRSRTRPSTGRRRCAGWPTRSAGSTTARPSPACSCRCGSCEAYRALAIARGVPHPGRVRRWRTAIGRRIELAFLADADRAAALPQRPAQRQLHRRRRRGSGSSTGSTPAWATRSSTSATSASTTSLTPDEDAHPARGLRRARSDPRAPGAADA